MGCSTGDPYCTEHENPPHEETIEPFWIAKREVTFEQWEICVQEQGCSYMPRDMSWGRKARPVVNVSWHDAQQYISWLNTKTGLNFRLPTEREWEFAARAGTSSRYFWGNEIGDNHANCVFCGSTWTDYFSGMTAPVGSFEPNEFGVYDMHGNVWEWVQDCWTNTYEERYEERDAEGPSDCTKRVSRGGSWNSVPREVRSSVRVWIDPSFRFYAQGFRLARDHR